MKKQILVLIFGLILSSNLFAQSNSDEIRLLQKREEVTRLENCIVFFEEHEKNIEKHYHKGSLKIIEVKPNSMNRDEFSNLCQKYSKNVVALERNLKYNPNISDYHIIYACNQQDNTTEINMYYEATMNSPVELMRRIDTEIKEYEEELNKIRNNMKYYQDLSNTLKHQMNYNLVETVDNAGDLLLKHVSLPDGVDKIAELAKEEAMKEIREQADINEEKSIANRNADAANSVVSSVEKIINYVPHGDKLTSNYLWRLFKSTPEAGKGLGHLAASVNIYFRKGEYDKEVEKWKKEEALLLEKININNKPSKEFSDISEADLRIKLSNPKIKQ